MYSDALPSLTSLNGERPFRCGKGLSCKVLCIDKPGPVRTTHLRTQWALSFIWDAVRTTPLSTYPLGFEHAALSDLSAGTQCTWSFSPWGLPSRRCRHRRWWALTPPFHLFPPKWVVSLSAALSVAPPFPVIPLPVRKHGTLCCPDFPPSGTCEPKSDRVMHRISKNGIHGVTPRATRIQR